MTQVELPLAPLVLSVSADQEPGPVPEGAHVLLSMDHGALSAGLIRRAAPDMVMCWLCCARYDAMEIAALLAEAAYEGRLIAAAPALPRPAMIEREMRARFPMLDFRIRTPVALRGRVAAYHDRLRARVPA